jgi:hypothetical protein
LLFAAEKKKRYTVVRQRIRKDSGSAENVKTTVGCVCELKFENKKRYSGLAENKKI